MTYFDHHPKTKQRKKYNKYIDNFQITNKILGFPFIISVSSNRSQIKQETL